ncbi:MULTISPECIES: MATE family efflux transporter [Clostridium]|jgi:putative MATE family efflux protein|uniref:MATE family efflux transporter n=1 Tax=Clostridium TaxID=1485 RepID=UPI000DD0A2E6|nr:MULTISPECIES: MATE family efflux transporter [Clostridium]MDB1933626.1 MATE family efflux transporter [Clostridium tertium]MDB1936165.1 MATE family efflux transporter [Clostridium tertium]MDB1941980.1 MATE family efflux transporter [Clostridium tertium]MDB1947512.1 MATE family efflux transporter [Clostridium tertium]MDU4736338.1 MATE family efflux transporter [Clostridium sp.]
MNNSLGKEVTFLSLIKFTLPTIIMMVFFSLYTIIDGIFVSRYIGSNALSAINIVYPVICILIGISVMMATGGSAIVAKFMGEAKDKEARESFTLITITSIIFGLIIAIFSLIFIKQIIYLLGSTDSLYENSHTYLFTMLLFTPVIILKMLFDYFLITAGNPNLGLLSAIIGGVTNIILDYVLIVPLNMGLVGAALATCIGYSLPSIIGIIYFFNKKNTLHFVKPKFNFKTILYSCSNGSSEMVTQISSAVTTFLYNIIMIKLLGENGVASITIVLYAQFLLVSAYIGFTSGVSPRISYNFGSKNKQQLYKIIKYSYIFIMLFSISTFIISKYLSPLLISIFAGNGTELYDITLNGFNLFQISFLLCGVNIFTSGMFTAFSNGKVSALLSLLRTFIFLSSGIIFLPSLIGVNGVWLAVPLAEIMTLVFSLFYIYKYKNIYGYSYKYFKVYA